MEQIYLMPFKAEILLLNLSIQNHYLLFIFINILNIFIIVFLINVGLHFYFILIDT